MSDSKKPTVSELKARYEGMAARDEGAFYLLGLVKRMGEALETVASLSNVYDRRTSEAIAKARALLNEIRE